MKLRYFIPTLVAVLAMLVGCSEDNDPTYLGNIKVSQSYIGLPAAGGSVTVTVNAADDWQFTDVPDWLTVSPAQGSAGQTEVTFSSGEVTETKTATINLKCGSSTQEINVVQEAEVSDPVIITVKEALDLIKSGNPPASAVYVRGIVCRIQEISVQYGNATYFLSDDGTYGDGNWLEVYRGLWIGAEKFTKGDEFGVGDELVVKGVLMDYNGTPETAQGTCEVISITKSLIGIDQVEMLGGEEGEGIGVTEFPLEGGQAKISVMTKGSGFHITIPEEAKKWLHIADFGANYVTLEADVNNGGDRTVKVLLSTEANGTTYTCEQAFTQKGAIVDVTVAEFNAAEVGDTQYRMTGIITRVANASYGNFYIADYSGETYVYGVGAKGYFETLGLEEGDIVTIVGKRGQYKETIEVLNTTVEDAKSVQEVTLDEFLAQPDDPTLYYKVTGIVDEIANASYGNLYLKSGDTRLYVYGCYPGWGATGDFRKNCLADKGIEVGDELTVIGVKSTYKDTPQVNGGIYFSHSKAGE